MSWHAGATVFFFLHSRLRGPSPDGRASAIFFIEISLHNCFWARERARNFRVNRAITSSSALFAVSRQASREHGARARIIITVCYTGCTAPVHMLRSLVGATVATIFWKHGKHRTSNDAQATHNVPARTDACSPHKAKARRKQRTGSPVPCHVDGRQLPRHSPLIYGQGVRGTRDTGSSKIPKKLTFSGAPRRRPVLARQSPRPSPLMCGHAIQCKGHNASQRICQHRALQDGYMPTRPRTH